MNLAVLQEKVRRLDGVEAASVLRRAGSRGATLPSALVAALRSIPAAAL